MRLHQDLRDDIAGCTVPNGAAALWWLGQLGFVLKLGATVVCIDPFLSPHPKRQVPPVLDPAELADVSVICGTHDHSDHIDRPAWPLIAHAAPKATFVAPALLCDSLAAQLALPRNRFAGLDDGLTLEFEGIKITGVASAHEFLDQDASGRFPYVGCMIEGNGCSIYHSGDCCIYEGLVTKLLNLKPDVMILPINGRDAVRYARHCIGNMTYQEAVDLAGSVKPKLVIPGHFDMFAANGENPRLFMDYLSVKYPGVRAVVPVHGERIMAG